MIYYLSITGNIERFINKLGSEYKAQSICDPNLNLWEGSIFICPTIGFGQPPSKAIDFLEKNGRYISYLVGSGNKNWGSAYCKAVDVLGERFNISVLMKFELQGTHETVRIFKENLNAILRTK